MADVIESIEHDHREVEQLFSQFESTRDRSIAEKICDELDKHTRGEEQAVYPVFADEVPGEQSLVQEGEGEHKEARQLIGQVRQTKDEDHLVDLMGQLKQAVQHHVQEEETEMLPKARQGLEPGRLQELADDFEAAKEASTP
jgi:hemerythrin-like domain-containing protein